MEYFGSLGIDVWLLIAQIINFALLLLILRHFLYKPLLKRIEKDEKELFQATEEKKKAEQQFALMKKQEEEMMNSAKKQSKKIIKDAEEIAKKIQEHAQEETETEKAAVIKQIKTRLEEIDDVKKAK